MITIYNENNQKVCDVLTYELNDADMGESTISCTVMFDEPIQFHPDWYVTLDGERYTLGVTEPSGKKTTARIREEYSLVFHSSRDDLKRYTFMDFVEYGSNNPQPARYTFSVMSCSLSQFVDRFNLNLRHYLGSAWEMRLSSGTDSSVTADFSIDKASLWDVLLDAYESYGVRWRIWCDNGVMVISIGETSETISTILGYGKGSGLVSIERTNTTERIITRLRGRGGSSNLPENYFHGATSSFPIADPDTNAILQTIYYDRLYPKCYRDYVRGYNSGIANSSETWAYGQGVADKVAGKPMNIVDFALSPKEDLWGISYGAIDDNDDIYPTLQGAMRNGSRIDNVIAVENILVDAPEGDSSAELSPFTPVIGENGQLQGRNGYISYNGKDGGVKNVHGSERATTVTMRSDEFAISDTVNTVNAKLAIIPSKVADFYAQAIGTLEPVSPMVITLADMAQSGWVCNEVVQLVSASTQTAIRTIEKSNEGFIDVSVDDIPPGAYYWKASFTWYYDGEGETERWLYTLDYSLYGCEYAEYSSESARQGFSSTFDIWIGNIWNTSKQSGESDEDYAYRVWEPLVSTEDMTVMFSDGLLAGEDYEFRIVGLSADADDVRSVIAKAIHYDTSKSGSHWRLTLEKSDAEFDASGKYLPNSVINAQPGNHFFFINIQMPYDPYVLDAERRLQEWLEEELSLLDTDFPTFSIAPSSPFMATFAEVGKIKPGNKVKLRNEELIGSTPVEMHIQSVTKKYTNNKINPEISFVVSDEVVATGNRLSLVEGQVEILSKQIDSSRQSVADAIASLQSLYMRRDGVDAESYSPTQFHRPLAIHDNLVDHNFQQGQLGGYGFGLYTDEYGNRVIESDIVVARMALRVNDIIAEQAEYVGGHKIYSSASMEVSAVEDVDTAWRCYFDSKQGTKRNLFEVGDGAYCQRFQGAEEGGYTTYWGRVTAIGGNYIEISKSDVLAGGTGTPSVGDTIVQLGHSSDIDRQSAIIMSAYGTNSPSFKLYHGIDGYSLAEKDMFGVEYDSENKIPYLYNYGSMRLGCRESEEDGQYILYDHVTKELDIRARVNFVGGSTGLSNVEEFVNLSNDLSELDYLKTLLTPNADVTTIDGGVVLSTIIGVRNGAEGDLVAGLNASTLGQDLTHGNMMIFAGVPEGEESVGERVSDARFQVYDSGDVLIGPKSEGRSAIELLADGSGQLANGGITWDEEGVINFARGIRIGGASLEDPVTLGSVLEQLSDLTSMFGIDSNGDIYVKNNRGFYSYSFISAGGLNPSSGGGGSGSDISVLTSWEQDDSEGVWALSSALGRALKTLAESGGLVGVIDEGTGTFVTDVSYDSASRQLTLSRGNAPSGGSLSAATKDALGGIKIGYSQNGKNYPVQLNISKQAYVNVPWSDTKITASSSASSESALKYYILSAFNGNLGTTAWYRTEFYYRNYPTYGLYMMIDGVERKVLTEADLEDIEGGGGVSTLSGLTDVAVTSPENGHILEYSNGVWRNTLPEYLTPSDIEGLVHEDNIDDLVGTLGYVKTTVTNDLIKTLGFSSNKLTYTKQDGASDSLTIGYATNAGTAENANNATSADSADEADKLSTARQIWGQSFDGTANVNGDITVNHTKEQNGNTVADNHKLSGMQAIEMKRLITTNNSNTTQTITISVDANGKLIISGSGDINVRVVGNIEATGQIVAGV